MMKFINRLLFRLGSGKEVITIMPKMATKTLSNKYFSRVDNGKISKQILAVSHNGWPIYFNEDTKTWRVDSLAFIWNVYEFDCVIHEGHKPTKEMQNAIIDESGLNGLI